jgi:hypothetical protein
MPKENVLHFDGNFRCKRSVFCLREKTQGAVSTGL